jgi:putative aldouronate transport system permease protein
MLLYVLLFNYAPLWGWINAFRDISNERGTLIPFLSGQTPAWYGIKNFTNLCSANAITFQETLRNTLAMSLINLVFGTVSAIVLAVLLNEVRQKSFKRTAQTVTYLPHFLSMIIVVGMAQIIFDSSDITPGPINQLLLSTGVVEKAPNWLGEEQYFWWLVGVINVWKEVGWGTIIYISAMTGIDPCLYEAAAIDGAGRFQRILHVTLPGIKSTFMILLIMNIGHLLDTGFEIQYLLKSPGTMHVAYTVDLYVMEYGTQTLDIGLATAAGIFKSVIAIVLLTGANFISKRLGEDSLL